MRVLILVLFACLFSMHGAKAASCSFTISNVDFGSPDTLNSQVVDTTATLSISCTSVLSGFVRICPNIQAGSGGSSGSVRQMLSPSSGILTYQLYQDSARSVVWGTADLLGLGGPPTFDLTTTAGGSISTTKTIYARLFGGQQTAAPATYTSNFAGGQTKFTYSELALFNCLTINSPTNPSFLVKAIVAANCLISAQAIDFGTHGVLRTNSDAAGGLSVTCTPGTTYSVSLDGGLSNGAPTARKMAKSGQTVTYGLYQDASRSVSFGSMTGQTVSGTGTGAAQSVPVYGRVPPQATPAAGTYTDTVVATVTY